MLVSPFLTIRYASHAQYGCKFLNRLATQIMGRSHKTDRLHPQPLLPSYDTQRAVNTWTEGKEITAKREERL